jgi:CheY-like chemotaxis protein
LLMPALSYAKEDRRRNNLSDHEELFLFKAMREIIEIAGTELQRSTLSEDGATASSVMDALPRIKIIGCPAHGEADEVALLMLRQLLESKNCSVEIVSSAALAAEVIARVREYNPDLLCISAVAPDGLVQVRYLSKRLRGSFPDISVVIGRWGLREFDENEDLPTDDLGKVGSTLLQTRDQITNLRQLISDADTKTRTEVFPASYD